MGEIKKIAVLTSGGDAPGMNAAIRSVVRAGIKEGYEVYGVQRGYHGLLRGELEQMDTRDVSEILQRGGTMLHTARSKEFTEEAGQQKAKEILEVFGIDALIVIGGDGSFRGARDLSKLGVPVIGIPATIDNDVACSDFSIGFDTAVNTGLAAIDRIRETASSHERCSVIEVMGRNAGFIAMEVGIGCGAECVLIPEVAFDLEKDVCQQLLKGRNMGKHHFIVVLAEGAGSAVEMAKTIEEITEIETRATVLGYVQRGGSPSAYDRMIASLMGIRAVECIAQGRFNRVVIDREGRIQDMDLEEGLSMKKNIYPGSLGAVDTLF